MIQGHSVQELEDIKASVERAVYVVDPRAVAEAMLRRAAAQRAARAAAERSPTD